MHDGVGGGRGGVINVLARSDRILQHMSSLDIQRVDYERDRDGERAEKREGERKEMVAPATSITHRGLQPASAAAPQPHRAAPRAPPKATTPPPS
jgi:hypothetical protein